MREQHLLLYSALPQGKFIMKKSLLWAPFLGWYAWLIGCIPVDRARGAAAMKAMLAAVRNPQRFAGGQLIIFPQGTRVAPGVRAEYKIGAGALVHRDEAALRSGGGECRGSGRAMGCCASRALP